MDYYHDRPETCLNHSLARRSSSSSLVINRTSLLLAITVIAAAIVSICLQQAEAQDQNAPPILYVRERNWRIPETEKVGQVIQRVSGEDPDRDDLLFGIEPRIFPQPGSNGNAPRALPFRIDPDTGVVYLNESLAGRAGENFLIYITVSDGHYTAKTEVFINILGPQENNFNYRSPSSSISNVVHNISKFLPSFGSLPGVQSIRNGQSYANRPSNNFPPSLTGYEQPIVPYYHPIIPTTATVNEHGENSEEESESKSSAPPAVTTSTTPRSRTKLTPIGATKPVQTVESEGKTTYFTIKSTTIPIIVTVCGFLAVMAALFGYLCRRRLCAISKNLKKSKEKEELARKSNQSQLSSTLTDDSRNSMVMQQWNGPVAFANRYVPWERDQQIAMTATSQLSTSAANGGDASAVPPTGGASPQAGCVGPATGYGHGVDANSDRWEFPRHRLKFFNILGEGAFGQVWRCEANELNGSEGVTTVAVKTLKESATGVEKKDLLSELEVMKSLEPHINVVQLLGCCTDKDPTFVILEYVNRGKLQTYLRNSRAERHYGNTHGKSNILTSGDLTSFMYQVAKGMDYLTSRGIIHRDLAARNILITDDHTCKVADFGFARDVVTSKIYERKSEGKLPIRWMATESLYDNIFSAKSDIWSFGILMWEIVTLGSTPYPGISAADVMRKVRDGYRLEKPEHCRRELYNIMYYCWSQDPQERPMFAEIIQMLDKLLHTEMDYIELERFPDHNYYNIVNLSGEKL
ncbi:tyrosine kinase receptor Cad96Ca [Drosophila tropicalis]|uniref:tyrosine kinase receptor Cad96Ca n=1 Tax=Drosophila tropicalis TaxID=46794 RepID=UPI0035ABF3FD